MNALHTTFTQLCNGLGMKAFCDAMLAQEGDADYAHKTSLERVLEALEAQAEHRQSNKVKRLHTAAKLEFPFATIEALNQSELPIPLSQLIEYSRGGWVKDGLNLGFTGPTGGGKTSAACAIANELIVQRIPVLYIHFNRLIHLFEILGKNPSEQHEKQYKKLETIPVLLIDDWALTPLSANARKSLFDLIRERHSKKRSMILTSQYDICDWHDAIQDKTVADSIIDRIISFTIHLNWDNESLRQKLGKELIAKNMAKNSDVNPSQGDKL